MSTILDDTKVLLDAEDFTGFDNKILGFIGDALLSLYDVGCVKDTYEEIDEDTEWEHVFKIPPEKDTIPTPLLMAIKNIVYIKVKLLFDPPNNTQYLEKKADELLWRIRINYDRYEE